MFLGTLVIVLLLEWSSKQMTKPKYMKLPKGEKAIIMGHSHAYYGLTDGLLQGAYNLSEPMEGYLYTYYKLVAAKKNNPSLDQMFLEYTNNQVTYYAKERLWGRYMPYLFTEQYALLGVREKVKIFSKEPVEVLKCLPSILKNNVQFMWNKPATYWGYKWEPTEIEGKKDTGLTDSKEEMLEEQNYSKDYRASMESLFYLKKIVGFCNKNKIDIFFFRSPLRNHGKKDQSQNFSEYLFKTIHRDFFKDIPLFDFADLPFEQKHFLDLTHLNQLGARSFTKLFNSVVERTSLKDTAGLNRKVRELVSDFEIE